jgi:hypothetical protein
LVASGIQRAVPRADPPVVDVVDAVTTLGRGLADTADPAANWVASPLSIANAMAMLRAGAGPRTAAEIDAALAFPSRGLHDAFNAISREIVPAKPRSTDQFRW